MKARYILKPILTLVYLLTSVENSVVFAQSILQGKVIDKVTGEALVGVAVSTGKINTFTNIDGLFTISTNNNDSVEINFYYIGYEKLKLKLKPTAQLVIQLSPAQTQLDEAVVTGSRNQTELKRQTVSVDVIKPYLIEKRITTNMENAMNQLPSVNVVDGQLNIRSGSGWTYGAGSRVLLLVDDVPLTTGDAGQVQWKFIPTDNIRSVEVIKGASSVMYGSGALNGIVNIRTARPDKKPRFSFQLFNGVYSMPQRDSAKWWKGNRWQNGFNGFYSQKIKRLELTLGVNALNDQGYRLGEFDKRVRTNFKTNYLLSKQHQFEVGIDGSFMTQQSASFLLWESFSYGYTALDSAQTKTNATLFSLDPHADFVFKKVKLRYRGRYYSVNNDLDESSTGVDQDNSSINAYNELVSTLMLNKQKGTLSAGISGNYTESNSALYGGKALTATNFATFAQLDLLLKKLTLSTGVRYETFTMENDQADKVIGRFGLSYQLFPATFLRGSIGQGYRYPTIAERYIETSVGLVNVFPNPNLRPEEGNSAELGLKQGFKWGALKGYADVAYFLSEYNNMVEFNFGQWRNRTFSTPPPSFFDLRNIGFTSFNIGTARISGIDAVLQGAIEHGKWSYLFLAGYTYALPIMLEPQAVFATDSSNRKTNYTYNYTSTDTSENYLKYRYVHLAKLDMQVTYKQRYMLGVSLRYNSRMKNVDRVFTEIPLNIAVPGVERGRALNASGDFIIDLRASYTINRFTFSLVINNVLNTEIMTRPADLRPTRLSILQVGYKF
ncbi:MAG: TonB-dependent receptor domain-containing protein [Bacteroidota bacterium]